MSDHPIDRTSSLETNLFAGLNQETGNDDEVNRLQEMLMSGLNPRPAPTTSNASISSLPIKTIQRGAQPSMAPPNKPTITTITQGTTDKSRTFYNYMATIVEGLKRNPETQSKALQLNELVSKFKAGKIAQDSLVRGISTLLGKDLTMEAYNLGVRDGTIKTGQSQDPKQQHLAVKFQQSGQVTGNTISTATAAPMSTSNTTAVTAAPISTAPKTVTGSLPVATATNPTLASTLNVAQLPAGVKNALSAHLGKLGPNLTQEQKSQVLRQLLLKQQQGGSTANLSSLTGTPISTGGTTTATASPINKAPVTAAPQVLTANKKPKTEVTAATPGKGQAATGQKGKEEPISSKDSIKDITDVTRLAGVDVKQESAQILEDTAEELPIRHEPEEEPIFINPNVLKQKITETAAKKGIKHIDDQVYLYLAFAVQDHLRNLVDRLDKVALARIEVAKQEFLYKPTSDVKRQLSLIEQREREEDTKRRKLEEKPVQEKPLDPKEEEQRKINDTNTTALQLIGDVRLKKPTAPTTTMTPTATPVSSIIDPTKSASAPMTTSSSYAATASIPKPASPAFTKAHLEQLKKLSELGASRSPEQEQAYQTLKAQFTRLHAYQQQQQQQQAILQKRLQEQKARGLSAGRVVTMKDLLYSPHIVKPEVISKWEVNKKKKQALRSSSTRPVVLSTTGGRGPISTSQPIKIS